MSTQEIVGSGKKSSSHERYRSERGDALTRLLFFTALFVLIGASVAQGADRWWRGQGANTAWNNTTASGWRDSANGATNAGSPFFPNSATDRAYFCNTNFIVNGGSSMNTLGTAITVGDVGVGNNAAGFFANNGTDTNSDYTGGITINNAFTCTNSAWNGAATNTGSWLQSKGSLTINTASNLSVAGDFIYVSSSAITMTTGRLVLNNGVTGAHGMFQATAGMRLWCSQAAGLPSVLVSPTVPTTYTLSPFDNVTITALEINTSNATVVVPTGRTLTIGTLTMSAGTLDLNGANVTITGTTALSGGTIKLSGGTLTIQPTSNAAAAIVISGTGSIDATGGGLIDVNTTNAGGNFATGTPTWNASTAQNGYFNDPSHLSTTTFRDGTTNTRAIFVTPTANGGNSFGNVTVDMQGNQNCTFQTNTLVMSGVLTLPNTSDAGTLTFTAALDALGVSIQRRTFTSNSNVTVGASGILVGTVTQNNSKTFTMTGGTLSCSGPVTLGQTTGNNDVSFNLNNVAHSITGGMTINDVTAGTVTLGDGGTTVSNGLTMNTNSKLDWGTQASGTNSFAGDMTISAGTLTRRPLTFVGGGTISGAGTILFTNVTFANTGWTTTLATNINVNGNVTTNLFASVTATGTGGITFDLTTAAASQNWTDNTLSRNGQNYGSVVIAPNTTNGTHTVLIGASANGVSATKITMDANSGGSDTIITLNYGAKRLALVGTGAGNQNPIVMTTQTNQTSVLTGLTGGMVVFAGNDGGSSSHVNVRGSATGITVTYTGLEFDNTTDPFWPTADVSVANVGTGSLTIRSGTFDASSTNGNVGSPFNVNAGGNVDLSGGTFLLQSTRTLTLNGNATQTLTPHATQTIGGNLAVGGTTTVVNVQTNRLQVPGITTIADGTTLNIQSSTSSSPATPNVFSGIVTVSLVSTMGGTLSLAAHTRFGAAVVVNGTLSSANASTTNAIQLEFPTSLLSPVSLPATGTISITATTSARTRLYSVTTGTQWHLRLALALPLSNQTFTGVDVQDSHAGILATDATATATVGTSIVVGNTANTVNWANLARADAFWDGSDNTSWTDANNWVGNVTPLAGGSGFAGSSVFFTQAATFPASTNSPPSPLSNFTVTAPYPNNAVTHAIVLNSSLTLSGFLQIDVAKVALGTGVTLDVTGTITGATTLDASGAGTGDVIARSGLTITGFTANTLGAGKLKFNGNGTWSGTGPFGNAQILGGTITSNSGLSVTTLDVAAGSLNLNTNNNLLTVTGGSGTTGLTVAGNGLLPDTASTAADVQFSGASSWSGSGVTTFGDVVITGTGVVTLGSDVTVESLTIQDGGRLLLGGFNLKVNQSLSVTRSNPALSAFSGGSVTFQSGAAKTWTSALSGGATASYGPVAITNGSVLFGTTSSASIASLTFSTGTSLNVQNGSITSAGTTDASGTNASMTIGATGAYTTAGLTWGTGTFTNNATPLGSTTAGLFLSGGSWTTGTAATNYGNVVVQTATVTAGAVNNLTASSVRVSSGALNFSANANRLIITGGAGAVLNVTGTGFVANNTSGTADSLQFTTGATDWTGPNGATTYGAVSVVSGATVTLQGTGNTIRVDNLLVQTGSGRLNVRGNTVAQLGASTLGVTIGAGGIIDLTQSGGVASQMTVAGDWASTAGTLTLGGAPQSTVTFNAGSGTQTVNSTLGFARVAHNAAGTLRIGASDLTCAAFNQSAGSLDLATNGTKMVISGGIAGQGLNIVTSSVTTDAGTATDFEFSGAATFSGTVNFGNVRCAGTGAATLASNVTLNRLVLDAGGGSLAVAGFRLISNTLVNIAGGTLNASGAGSVIEALGDWTATSGAFTSLGSLVELTGSSAQAINSSLATDFNNLTVKKSADVAVTVGTSTFQVSGTLLLDPTNLGTFINGQVATIGYLSIQAGGTAPEFTSSEAVTVTGQLTVASGQQMQLTGAAAGQGLSVALGTFLDGTLTLSAANDSLSGGVIVNPIGTGGSLALGTGTNTITGGLQVNGTGAIPGTPAVTIASGNICGSTATFPTLGAVTFSGAVTISDVTTALTASAVPVGNVTINNAASLDLNGHKLSVNGTAFTCNSTGAIDGSDLSSGVTFNTAATLLTDDRTTVGFGQNYGDVSVANAAGVTIVNASIATALSVRTLTLGTTSSTFDYNGKLLAFVGNDVNTPLTVPSDALFRDTLGTGTVVFAVGAAAGTISIPGTNTATPTITYSNLRIDNTAVAPAANQRDYRLVNNSAGTPHVTTKAITITRGTLDASFNTANVTATANVSFAGTNSIFMLASAATLTLGNATGGTQTFDPGTNGSGNLLGTVATVAGTETVQVINNRLIAGAGTVGGNSTLSLLAGSTGTSLTPNTFTDATKTVTMNAGSVLDIQRDCSFAGNVHVLALGKLQALANANYNLIFPVASPAGAAGTPSLIIDATGTINVNPNQASNGGAGNGPTGPWVKLASATSPTGNPSFRWNIQINGIQSFDNIKVQDSFCFGGSAPGDAGSNSIDLGNNFGWINLNRLNAIWNGLAANGTWTDPGNWQNGDTPNPPGASPSDVTFTDVAGPSNGTSPTILHSITAQTGSALRTILLTNNNLTIQNDPPAAASGISLANNTKLTIGANSLTVTANGITGAGNGSVDASGGGNVTVAGNFTVPAYTKGAGTLRFNGSGNWSTTSDCGTVVIDGNATMTQITNTLTMTSLTLGRDTFGDGTLKLAALAVSINAPGTLTVGGGTDNGTLDATNGGCLLTVRGTYTQNAAALDTVNPTGLTTTLNGVSPQAFFASGIDSGNLTITTNPVNLTGTLKAQNISGAGVLAANFGPSPLVTVLNGLTMGGSYQPGTLLVFGGSGNWSGSGNPNFGAVKINGGATVTQTNASLTMTTLTIGDPAGGAGAGTLRPANNASVTCTTLTVGSANNNGTIDATLAAVNGCTVNVSGTYNMDNTNAFVTAFGSLTTVFTGGGTQQFFPRSAINVGNLSLPAGAVRTERPLLASALSVNGTFFLQNLAATANFDATFTGAVSGAGFLDARGPTVAQTLITVAALTCTTYAHNAASILRFQNSGTGAFAFPTVTWQSGSFVAPVGFRLVQILGGHVTLGNNPTVSSPNSAVVPAIDIQGGELHLNGRTLTANAQVVGAAAFQVNGGTLDGDAGLMSLVNVNGDVTYLGASGTANPTKITTTFSTSATLTPSTAAGNAKDVGFLVVTAGTVGLATNDLTAEGLDVRNGSIFQLNTFSATFNGVVQNTVGSGTLTATGSTTVTLKNGMTINSYSAANSTVFNGTGSWSGNGGFNGTTYGPVTVNAGTVSVGAAGVKCSSMAINGGATLGVAGTGVTGLNDTGTLTLGDPAVTVLGAGTIDATASAGSIQVASDYTQSSQAGNLANITGFANLTTTLLGGNFTPRTAINSGNITIDSAGTVTLTTANLLCRALTLSTGTFNATGRNINATGDVNVSGGTFTMTTTLTLQAGGAQLLTMGANSTGGNLSVTTASTQVTLGSSLTVTGTTTLATGTKLTVSSGTGATFTGNTTVNGTGNLRLDDNTTFTGQVAVNGTGLLDVGSGPVVTFNNATTPLAVAGPSGTGATLQANVGPCDIVIRANATNASTLAGTVNFTLAGANQVRFISTLRGTPFKLNVSGAQTFQNVRVRDSNASFGNLCVPSGTSTDLGNNTNWNFAANDAVAAVWNGLGAAGNWADFNNWVGFDPPTTNSSATFNLATPNNPSTSSPTFQLRALTTAAPFVGTVTISNDLTVNGPMSIGVGTQFITAGKHLTLTSGTGGISGAGTVNASGGGGTSRVSVANGVTGVTYQPGALLTFTGTGNWSGTGNPDFGFVEVNAQVTQTATLAAGAINVRGTGTLRLGSGLTLTANGAMNVGDGTTGGTLDAALGATNLVVKAAYAVNSTGTVTGPNNLTTTFQNNVAQTLTPKVNVDLGSLIFDNSAGVSLPASSDLLCQGFQILQGTVTSTVANIAASGNVNLAGGTLTNTGRVLSLRGTGAGSTATFNPGSAALAGSLNTVATVNTSTFQVVTNPLVVNGTLVVGDHTVLQVAATGTTTFSGVATVGSNTGAGNGAAIDVQSATTFGDNLTIVANSKFLATVATNFTITFAANKDVLVNGDIVISPASGNITLLSTVPGSGPTPSVTNSWRLNLASGFRTFNRVAVQDSDATPTLANPAICGVGGTDLGRDQNWFGLQASNSIWVGLGLTDSWAEDANWSGGAVGKPQSPNANVFFNTLTTRKALTSFSVLGLASLGNVTINTLYAGDVSFDALVTVSSVSIDNGTRVLTNGFAFGAGAVTGAGTGELVATNSAVTVSGALSVPVYTNNDTGSLHFSTPGGTWSGASDFHRVFVQNNATVTVGSGIAASNASGGDCLTINGGGNLRLNGQLLTATGSVNLGSGSAGTLTANLTTSRLTIKRDYFQGANATVSITTPGFLTIRLDGQTLPAQQIFTPRNGTMSQGILVVSRVTAAPQTSVRLDGDVQVEALTVASAATLDADTGASGAGATVSASGATTFNGGVFTLDSGKKLILNAAGAQTLVMGASSVGGTFETGNTAAVAVNTSAFNVTGATNVADGTTLTVNTTGTFTGLVTVGTGGTACSLTIATGVRTFTGGVSVASNGTLDLRTNTTFGAAASSVAGSLVATTNAITLTFPAGLANAFAISGTCNISPGPDLQTNLISSTLDTQWFLTLSGGGPKTFRNVRVRDSNANGNAATAIDDPGNVGTGLNVGSIDLGDNTSWTFPHILTAVWVGGTSTNWSTAANWAGTDRPTQGSRIIVDATATFGPQTGIAAYLAIPGRNGPLGNIEVNSLTTQTFGAALANVVAIDAPLTIAGLLVNNPVPGPGTATFQTGANLLTVQGAITGTGALNASGGSVIVGDTGGLNKDFTIGSFTPGSSLTFKGTGNWSGGSPSFGPVNIINGANVTLASATIPTTGMNIRGNATLTLAGNALNVSSGGVLNLGSTALSEQGHIDGSIAGSQLNLTGDYNQEFAGTSVNSTNLTTHFNGGVVTRSFKPIGTINQGDVLIDNGETVQLTGGGTLLTRALTVSSGQLDARTNPASVTTNGNVSFAGGSAIFENIAAPTKTFTLNASGNLNAGGSTITINLTTANAAVVTLTGNLSVGSGTNRPTMTVASNTTFNVANPFTASFNGTVTVNSPGGILDLEGNTTFNQAVTINGTVRNLVSVIAIRFPEALTTTIPAGGLLRITPTAGGETQLLSTSLVGVQWNLSLNSPANVDCTTGVAGRVQVQDSNVTAGGPADGGGGVDLGNNNGWTNIFPVDVTWNGAAANGQWQDTGNWFKTGTAQTARPVPGSTCTFDGTVSTAAPPTQSSLASIGAIVVTANYLPGGAAIRLTQNMSITGSTAAATLNVGVRMNAASGTSLDLNGFNLTIGGNASIVDIGRGISGSGTSKVVLNRNNTVTLTMTAPGAFTVPVEIGQTLGSPATAVSLGSAATLNITGSIRIFLGASLIATGFNTPVTVTPPVIPAQAVTVEGTLTMGTGALTTTGHWTSSTATAVTFPVGGTLSLQNTAVQTLTLTAAGTETFGNVNVLKGGSSVSVVGRWNIGGSLSLQAGNVAPVAMTSGALIVASNVNMSGGNLTLFNTAAPANSIGGNVTATLGQLNLAGTVNVGGDWSFSLAGTASFAGGGSTVVFNGANAQVITLTSSGALAFNNLTVTKAGAGAAGIASVTGLVATGLAVNGTLSLTQGGLTLTNCGGTVGNVTSTGGALVVSTAAVVNVNGNWFFSGGGTFSFASAAASVNFATGATHLVTSGVGNTYAGVTVSGSGIVQLQDNMSAAGTVDVNGGQMVITNRTLSLVGTTSTPLVGPGGNFTAGAPSTVSFAPTADGTYTVPAFVFNNLTVNRTNSIFATNGATTVTGTLTINPGGGTPGVFQPNGGLTAGDIAGSGRLDPQGQSITIALTNGSIATTVSIVNLIAPNLVTLDFQRAGVAIPGDPLVYGHLMLSSITNGGNDYTVASGATLLNIEGNLTLSNAARLISTTSLRFQGPLFAVYDAGSVATMDLAGLTLNKDSLTTSLTMSSGPGTTRRIVGPVNILQGTLDLSASYDFAQSTTVGTSGGPQTASFRVASSNVELRLGTAASDVIDVHDNFLFGNGIAINLKLVFGFGSTLRLLDSKSTVGFNGQTTFKLKIETRTPGAQSRIATLGSARGVANNISARDVSVLDNDARGVVDATGNQTPVQASSSVDRGNNLNWNFIGGGSLLVLAATAQGDGNGRMNAVRLKYGRKLDIGSIGNVHQQFHLQQLDAGGNVLTSIQGTSTNLVSSTNNDNLVVLFGSGLGRTDVTDVQVTYTAPTSGFLQSFDGIPAATDQNMKAGGSPNLADGAPPVLIGAFAQDVDQNIGLDRMVFIFSEPLGFTAARGMSVSGFDVETSTLNMGTKTTLRLKIAGESPPAIILDQQGPLITGAQIAGRIQQAVQTFMTQPIGGFTHDPLNRPAYMNFACTFTGGRYTLRAGVPLAFDGATNTYRQDYTRSTVEVLVGGANDATPVLKLGVANGGVEKLGSGDAVSGVSYTAVIPNPDNTGLSGTRAGFALNGEDSRDYLVTSGQRLELVAQDIENAVRAPTNEPQFVSNQDAYSSFVAVPDRGRGRLVLLNGSVGGGSTVVANSGNAFANIGHIGSAAFGIGAKETMGQANTLKAVADLTIQGMNGANLMAGKTDADVQVSGSTITVNLTNVPNSGVATPSFIWVDNGDTAYLADRAPVPNGSTARFSNLQGTSNVILLGDTNADLKLTKSPGLALTVDASQTVAYVATLGVGVLYEWKFRSGPQLPANVVTQGPVLQFDAKTPGDYLWQLSVLTLDAQGVPIVSPYTDATGREVTIVTITIEAKLPVPNAGGNRLVIATSITLDGSASFDPNGGGIAYVWTAVNGAGQKLASNVFSNDQAQKPVFTPGQPGTYTVTLTVYKASDLSLFSSDTVTITLSSASDLVPTANPGFDQVARVNQLVTLDATASADPEGVQLKFNWSVGASPGLAALSDSSAARPTFTPTIPGVYTFSLTVSDATFTSLPESVRIVVIDDSGASPRRGPTAEPRATALLHGVFLTTVPGDLATNPPTLKLQDGAERAVKKVVLPTDPPPLASDVQTLLRVDFYSGTTLAASLYYERVAGDDSPLEVAFSSGGTTSEVVSYGIAGQPFVLDGTRSQDNQVIQTYSWKQIEGPFKFGTQQGALFSVVPQTAGTYVFELTVTDNVGLSSFTRRVRVPVVPAGTVGVGPPEAKAKIASGATTVESVTQLVGTTIAGTTVSLTASDSFARGGGALTFEWTQLSGPLAVLTGENTNTLSFLPKTTGAYYFQCRVTDANGVNDVVNVWVTAGAPGKTVPVAVLQEVKNQTITSTSVTVTLDGSQSKGDGTLAFTFSQNRGVPMFIESAGKGTGTVKIDQPGTYTFLLAVSDGQTTSSPAYTTFRVEVSPQSPLSNGRFQSKTTGGFCAIAAGEPAGAGGLSPLLIAIALFLGARRVVRRW